MQVSASGGLFLVTDPETDQKRFETGEIVTTGPIFGPKMRKPEGVPGELEEEILQGAGVSEQHFGEFAKLTPGTRRPFLIRPVEYRMSEETGGLRMEFTLPAGVYATTFLREFQKNDV